MKKTIKILSEKRGSAPIWMPFLVLGLFIFGTVMWEYSRLNIVGLGVRDAVQAAITQVCTDNYDKVYNGVREGYSGGYKLDSLSWAENVDPGSITALVDKKLGSNDGAKITNGKTEFSISNLQVQITNAPLAPTDSDGAQQFTGTATFTLTVPLSFGWQALPPMTAHMTVSGGYSPHGEVSSGSGEGGSDVPVTGLILSDSDLVLMKGDYAALSASVQPDDATDPAVTWVSSDEGIATVDQTGLVKGVEAGTTTVTALSQGGIAQCHVQVITPVESIALNKYSLTLHKGNSETLIATVTPDNASDKSLWWTTSDPNICTVDATGKVTGVNTGTAEIIVASQESGAMARCAVTVDLPATDITLDPSTLMMDKGTQKTLTATIDPDGATNQGVLWAAANSSVATVDQSGNVTAVDGGLSIVTATTMDGQHVAQCAVTVIVRVTGITLNKTELSLDKGSSERLIATIWPLNATDKSVIWSSLNPLVASVDQSGAVTAVSPGTTIISGTSHDGGYTANCTVTVIRQDYTVTANAVHGSVTGAGTYTQGSNVTLNATPDTDYQFVNWTDENGNIIGTSQSYTISNLDADTTLTANFELIPSLWTIIDNGDGTCTAIGYSKDANTPNVAVPTYIKGLKVTALGPHQVGTNAYTGEPIMFGIFRENLKVKTVTIPSTVKTIGAYSFYDNYELSQIDIPDSVTSIGAHAFDSCRALRSISIPNTIKTIEDSTFQSAGITSINIPDSVTSIGVSAFEESGLSTVNISNSVKSIGESAFMFTALTSVTIPDSVTAISDDTFSYCSKLTSVKLPNALKSIGNSAFTQCTTLTSIVLPNSVTSIGSMAFYGCNGLTSITLSNSLISIDSMAFQGCGFTSITIPGSVTSIQMDAFAYCTGLKSIDIPKSVATMGMGVFSGWKSPQTINIHGKSSKAAAETAWGKLWEPDASVVIHYYAN